MVFAHQGVRSDLVASLREQDLDVCITEQTSLEDINAHVVDLGEMLGAPGQARALSDQLRRKLDAAEQFARTLDERPKVYIEESCGPPVCGPRLLSELVEICGGVDVFANTARMPASTDRIVGHEAVIESNADIMIACWRDREFDRASILGRDGYQDLPFVKKHQINETESCVMLQPGIAPVLHGVPIIAGVFGNYQYRKRAGLH